MKKFSLLLIAGFAMLALSADRANAQISLNINIGNWSPPAEYSGVDYYYLPDVESYYYAPKRQFVYQESGRWVFRNSLPARYRDYRLDNGYKVAVDRPQAYKYFATDRVTYGKFKGRKGIGPGNSFNAHNKIKFKGNNGHGHDRDDDRGHGRDDDHGPGRGNGHGKGHGKH